MDEETKEPQYPNQEFQNLTLNQSPLDISPEVKVRLQEIYEEFNAHLSQEDYQGLTIIIKDLREALSSPNGPFTGRNIIEMGIIPYLLNLLSDSSPRERLKTEIAWLLANISAGNSDETRLLVEFNIIPVIIRVFKDSYDEDLQENIMWTLANIAGEQNLVYRDQIFEEGILYSLAKELTKSPKKISHYRTATWLIANLVRGRPYPPYEKIERIFSLLTNLMDYPDDVIQGHVLSSLVYLTEEAQPTHLKSIYECCLVQKIVYSIGSKDEKISSNAIKVTANLAKGNQNFLPNSYPEIFKMLPQALKSHNAEVRRESCLLLANIFDKDFDDHDYIADYDILNLLIQIASQDKETDIRVQATLCLQKFLATATVEYALTAIEGGAVEVFMQNLQENDERLVENSIMAFYKVLEFGESLKDKNGGYNFIVKLIMINNYHTLFEGLLTHQNQDIALKAEVLFEKFFREFV